jgi:hypothetical protein
MRRDSFEEYVLLIPEDLLIQELCANMRVDAAIPQTRRLECLRTVNAGGSQVDIGDLAGTLYTSFCRVVWKIF